MWDHPEHQEQGKVPIESSKGKDKGYPLEKTQSSGVPAPELLLREFRDVFHEDLPAETPPE